MKYIAVGFVLILFICLLVLKLTDKVSWSWLWIFSPLWIGAIIAIAMTMLGVYTLTRTPKG